MTNTNKQSRKGWRTALATGLVALTTLVGSTNAGTVEGRVFYDTTDNRTRTELRASDNGSRGLAETDGEDTRLGAHLNYKGQVLNAGYQKIDDKESTRVYTQVGGNTKIAAGIQTLEGTDDFWETYITTKVRASDLELGANSKNHVTAVARTPIDKDNSVALTGSLSTEDGNYRRIAGALAHSGKVGFLAYAIIGENENGAQYRDFRIRGGLGGKTGTGAIGVISLNESCFFDEDTIYDITDPAFTGTFGNYTANVRGSPLGFDLRYINDVASGQVAMKAGRITLMPTYRNNLETHKEGLDLEVIADLGKGFSARVQYRTAEDKQPEQAGMLSYAHSF